MIHLSCALKYEAKPLLDFFKLSHYAASDLFPVYVDRKQEISLTRTGMGKLAAAAAAIYTHSLFATEDNDIWLNIGIAGHKDHAVGSLRLANRIEDADSGERWYPQIVVNTDIQSGALLTLSRPGIAYCEQMYDMEAAGFYNSVSRFGTAELCHSIKVISDNEEHPANTLARKDAATLLTAKLASISALIDTLTQLADELVVPGSAANVDAFVSRWHFTHYQRNQLQQLLQRWQILLPDKDPLYIAAGFAEGKEVLKALAYYLDSAPASYV